MTTCWQNGPSSFSQGSKTNILCLRGFALIPVQSVIRRRIGGLWRGEDTGKTFLLQKNRGKTFVCRKMLLYLPSRKQ